MINSEVCRIPVGEPASVHLDRTGCLLDRHKTQIHPALEWSLRLAYRRAHPTPLVTIQATKLLQRVTLGAGYLLEERREQALLCGDLWNGEWHIGFGLCNALVVRRNGSLLAVTHKRPG